MELLDMESLIFFFNDTATTEIYTLSLHDALPIWMRHRGPRPYLVREPADRATRSRVSRSSTPPIHDPRARRRPTPIRSRDRKSTRLNSSHANISYAVFCLKKNRMEQVSIDTFVQT